MEIISLSCTTLEDAWFQAISAVMSYGREFKIDFGSYAGQSRKELDYITIHIKNPGVRPLVPLIPPHYFIPNPTSIEYVENEYMLYLLDDYKKPFEEYVYGTYIKPQFYKIIERYKKIFAETGGYRSNQEHIIVGDYRDHLDMEHPPCLRSIDTRIQDGVLHYFVYFRSWDLWAGFPSNMAGIQIMKEIMAKEIGVDDGEIIVSSKGLHLYSYAWDFANVLLGRKNNDLQVC